MHWWLGQWTSWSKTSWRDRWCRHRMSWCFFWISWSWAWSLHWAFPPLTGFQLGCMSHNERILDHPFMLHFVLGILGTDLCIKLTQTSISKHCILLSLRNLQVQGPLLALVSLLYRSSRMFWNMHVHINTIEFFEFHGAQLEINWIAIYFASPQDAQISSVFLQATWVSSKIRLFSWKKSYNWLMWRNYDKCAFQSCQAVQDFFHRPHPLFVSRMATKAYVTWCWYSTINFTKHSYFDRTHLKKWQWDCKEKDRSY